MQPTLDELYNRYPGINARLVEMRQCANNYPYLSQEAVENCFAAALEISRAALKDRGDSVATISSSELEERRTSEWRTNWYYSVFNKFQEHIKAITATANLPEDLIKVSFKAAMTLELVIWQAAWSPIELQALEAGINKKSSIIAEDVSKALPIVASPFNPQTGLAKVPTGAPMIGSTYSFLYQWSAQPEGLPSYRYTFGQDKGQERYVETYIIDPTIEDNIPLVAMQGSTAWEIVNRFGVMHTYIHLLFGAYAMKQQRPWKDDFTITGLTLVNRLQMQKRRHDLTLGQQLLILARHCSDLARVGMEIYWPHGNRNFTISLSRIWHMDFDFHGQYHLYLAGADLTDFSITIRPGTWAGKFLNLDEAQDGSALFQYGVLAEKILLLDPVHHKELVRLALHVMFNARMRRHPRTDYKIVDILNVMFTPQEIEKAGTDRNLRTKITKNFFEDLQLLRERLEFSVNFPESFPKDLLPSWQNLHDVVNDTSRQLTLPRNYWPRLIEQSIDISPPIEARKQLPAWKGKTTEQATLTKLSRFATSKSNIKFDAQSDTGTNAVVTEQIKAARIAAGITIRKLAEMMSKSKAWIQKVEESKLTPRPEDLQKLKSILKLH